MHVAFAIDAPYLPWCAVAILSCLDHSREGLTVHLLHDGTLSGHAGVQRLATMVEGAGAVLAVHAVDADTVAALPSLTSLGKVVWLRCLLADLLPDIDRVLYLDADILVVGGLEPLFTADVGGAPVAAVTNIVTRPQRERIRALGILDHRQFFNAGVLLLDLEQLRAERASAALLGLAETRPAELEWADQDALNLVFAGRWYALHPRWNAQNTLWNDPRLADEALGEGPAAEARRAPAILHFEGPSLCKPWHALGSHPWRRIWWDTLKRTPWAGTPAEDHGAATTVLRVLPEQVRIRAYRRLLGWRNHRSVARRTSAAKP